MAGKDSPYYRVERIGNVKQLPGQHGTPKQPQQTPAKPGLKISKL